MRGVDLRPGFFVFVLILAGLDRGGILLLFFLAALAHELAHAAAILLCGGRIHALTLRFADVRMQTGGLSYRQELICALAGPFCNLACCVLLRGVSAAFAAFSLVLGAYNLLPILPLDGGRALRCALLMRLQPDAAERICRAVGVAVCALLALAGVWLGVMRRAGFWPLGMASFLLLRLLTLRLRDGKS